jgi:hypothetical protein
MEAVVIIVGLLPRHLSGGTEEDHDNPWIISSPHSESNRARCEHDPKHTRLNPCNTSLWQCE